MILGASQKPRHQQQQHQQTDALQQHDEGPENVWLLLLGEAWRPLDQSIVCKLLCCSQAMEDMIHTKCAGRLSVNISGVGHHSTDGPNGLPSSSQPRYAVGSWMAKHARLCSSIEISIPPGTTPAATSPQPSMPCSTAHSQVDGSALEAAIAAGLTAAGAQAAPAAASAAASSTIAAPTCVFAAAGPSSSSVQQQQQQQEEAEEQGGGSPLQLAQFSSNLPGDGKLLCALHGQTSLTALSLSLTSSRKPAAGCGAALASLTSLRSLTIDAQFHAPTASSSDQPTTGSYDIRDSYDIREIAAALEPALQPLTCLTHLSLSWMPDSTTDSFPPTLVSLQVGGYKSLYDDMRSGPGVTTLDLLHLPHLTHLDAYGLNAKSALPPSLRSLHVHRPLHIHDPQQSDDDVDAISLMMAWLGGQHNSLAVDISTLQPLQHLQLYAQPHPMSSLLRLTQLTHLGLQCMPNPLDESAAVLPRLPLRWLQLHGMDRWDGEHILAHLGSCTQLTYLQLQELSMPVPNLVVQLHKLPALQELHLASLSADSPAAARADLQGGGQGGMVSAWGPLFRAVALLTPLRKLDVEGLSLQGGDVDALRGASQLTCIRLARCGEHAGAVAQLRSAFAHLPDGMLEVGWCDDTV